MSYLRFGCFGLSRSLSARWVRYCFAFLFVRVLYVRVRVCRIHFNPESWWFLRPGSPYSIAEIRDWAARPLGASEKVAMAHGAYNLIYSGWGYSAVNQTRVSLLKLIGAPHFTQAQYDDERSCHGRFVDDWTVEPGYSTPGLNTQYDYTNGMENEFFPPYFPGDAIAWVPPSSPHPPYQC